MRRLLLLVVAAFSLPAFAGPNDIELLGLVDKSDPENPVVRQGDFRSLVREMGLIFTPSSIQPAETTGISGFDFAFTYAFHPVQFDKDYWQDSIEEKGNRLPMTIGATARKGFILPLPLASEIEMGAQYLIESQMVNLGANIRVALNEGFTGNHWWIIIPDIAGEIGINRVVGSDDLDLLTVTGGGSVSKGFGVFGSFNLTPYVAYKSIFVNASTRIVDANPEIVTNVEDNVVFDIVPLAENRIDRISGGVRVVVAHVMLSGGVDVNLLDVDTDGDDEFDDQIYLIQYGLRMGVSF